MPWRAASAPPARRVRAASAGREIVEQLARARQRALAADPPRRVSNIVFMEWVSRSRTTTATWAAIRRIHADMGIGARHLTVSTVGLVPGILRMAEETCPSVWRSRCTPRTTSCATNWCHQPHLSAGGADGGVCDLRERTRRRLSFEWAMIDGVNDRFEDAERLAGLARTVAGTRQPDPAKTRPPVTRCAAPGQPVAPSPPSCHASGVNVTVRDTRATTSTRRVASCVQVTRPRRSSVHAVAARTDPAQRTSTVRPSPRTASTSSSLARPWRPARSPTEPPAQDLCPLAHHRLATRPGQVRRQIVGRRRAVDDRPSWWTASSRPAADSSRQSTSQSPDGSATNPPRCCHGTIEATTPLPGPNGRGDEVRIRTRSPSQPAQNAERSARARCPR